MSSTDYFVNHQRARRFPWSLYHRPIEDDLIRFLGTVAAGRQDAEVLVIGCGLMQEIDRAPARLAFTLCDIDARAIDAVRAMGDPRVKDGLVVTVDTDLAELGRTFDAVYAKEVIEHIVPWREYLASLYAIVRPGGRLWLSTPNYGEPWLPLLEDTVLEAVARASGYTRKGMHPSRFSERSLAAGLEDAGFVDVEARTLPRRLALAAWAQKR